MPRIDPCQVSMVAAAGGLQLFAEVGSWWLLLADAGIFWWMLATAGWCGLLLAATGCGGAAAGCHGLLRAAACAWCLIMFCFFENLRGSRCALSGKVKRGSTAPADCNLA